MSSGIPRRAQLIERDAVSGSDTGGKQMLDLAKMPEIPLLYIPKPLDRWTWYERTQFWVHLLPYMLFPVLKDERRRNTMKMVLKADFQSHLKHRIDVLCWDNRKSKQLNNVVKIFFDELKVFCENDGFGVVAKAEPISHMPTRKNKALLRSLFTCLCIFKYLCSMHKHHQGTIGPGGPSLRKAKSMIKEMSAENESLHANSTSISNSWRDYKSSIHLIGAFEMCRCAARSVSTEFCHEDALDDIDLFMGLALYFQDELLSLPKNPGKGPLIERHEIWWLPNAFGVEKVEVPAKPLTEGQLARLGEYKTEFSTKSG
jgi:hypothetical protein